MVRAFVLWPALALLAACSESNSNVAIPEEARASSLATSAASGPTSWGEAILNFVPSRSDSAITSEAEVKAQFAACRFGSSGIALRMGECPAEQLIPNRPRSIDKLQIQISSDGDTVPAMRLIVCCSDGGRQPFEDESVIRAEKLCPEVTLVASQSAHVFRISAPGKRDFVHAMISHGAGTQKVVSHTILLAPSEAGSECSNIVAADKGLDSQFGAPSVRS